MAGWETPVLRRTFLTTNRTSRLRARTAATAGRGLSQVDTSTRVGGRILRLTVPCLGSLMLESLDRERNGLADRCRAFGYGGVVYLCIPLALLLSAGCIGRDTRSSWEGTISESAGVTVVTNTGRGVWGHAEGWSVVEDLVIGQADGRIEYLFGRIAGICVASDGRIVVLDQQASQLRVFDADGVFQYAFGAPGGGPGELGEAVGPCILVAGDTVVVPDPMNMRANRYTLDGTSVGSIPRDMREGISLRWDRSGRSEIAVQLRPLNLSAEERDSTDVVVVLGSDGLPVDTLLTFRSGRTVEMTGIDVALVWFSPDPSWVTTPSGGLAFGVNDRYRIEMIGSDGELERIFAKSHQPRQVTDADQRFFRNAVGDFLVHRVPRFRFDQIVNGMRFAEYYPAFFRILSGPQRSIWVQHVYTPSDMSEGERENFGFGAQHPQLFVANPRLALGAPDWDVFDEKGRFLGLVTLPDRFDPMTVVGNDLYGVWRDELDVEYVMKLSVLEP